MADLTWRKSTRCESHECIEIAFNKSSRCEHAHCVEVAYHRASQCVSESHCIEVATGDQVLVRDSKDLTITPLAFTPAAWRGFTDALKTGQFG